MSISYWLDRSYKNLEEEFDAVIVGAGIAGHSIAYWLHKEFPQFRIAVVDKGTRGCGATGRNAGFITCGSVEHFNRLVETHGKEKALEMWRFSEENLRLLQAELGLTKEKHQFEKRGSFSLAESENELNELKKCAALMDELGIDVEILDELECQERLGCEGFVGGIKYCNDASIHPIFLIDEIRERLDSNVVFYENCEVMNIERTEDSRLVKTNRITLNTSVVLLATNGYSPLIHSYFKGKIEPTRGQVLAIESSEPFMEGPCYANFVLDYFRQIPTGELIIGGFRQLEKEKEVGYSDEPNETIQKALEKFIGDHLPKLKYKKITHRWSGVMGFSFDGQPLIGSLPDDSQVFFLGGFTAHGLGLAFHGAKVLVGALRGETIPEFLSAKRI